MNAEQFNRLFENSWTGSLARFASTLRCGPPPEAGVALFNCFDPAKAPPFLDQLTCFSVAPIDRRAAVVSEWSKKWLSLFLMHWVWILHTRHRVITCSSADSYLLCDPNGLPKRLVLNQQSAQFPRIALNSIADIHYAYSPLLRALESAFVTLATYGKLNRRVLWNNAASIVEATLSYIGLHQSSVRLAYRYLLDTGETDHGRTPMYHAIQYVPAFHSDLGDPIRLRRVCCLRYLLADKYHCANCPRLKSMTHEQISILLEKWRGN